MKAVTRTYRIALAALGFLFGVSAIQAQTLTLSIPEQSAAPGGTITVPVEVSNFTDIASLSFTVGFDAEVLSFVSAQVPAAQELGFVLTGDPGEGGNPDDRATFAFINSEAQSLDDGTSIFEITFEAVGEDGEVSPINLLNAPTPIQARNGEGQSVEVETNNGSVTVSTGGLPVELVSFEAVADGGNVLLRWATASEQNNAGFHVERRSGAGAFEGMDFVSGKGTTTEMQRYSYRAIDLVPGKHVFRLKQVDSDGAFAYSPEVEVSVELPVAYELSQAYPNPFNPQSQFTLRVQNEQQMTVELFDALGRRAALLHEGALSAGEAHVFTIDGSGLNSGLYFVRVTGERFSDTLSVVLLK